MIKIFLFFISIFILINCSGKPKAVFICGDHECINKAEAEKYFEENLSIEVKLLKSKEKKEIDLVQLNLKEMSNHRQESSNSIKDDKNNLKVLSKNEIKEIKSKIKSKEVKKITQKKIKKKNLNLTKTKKKDIKVKIIKKDICKILDKCNIEEISKYLIKEGNNKEFPDITVRQ